jgi:hypothetical protein
MIYTIQEEVMAKRSLLPMVQQYANFLGQFRQQEARLKQNEYTFAKKKQGEQFIADYSKVLNESKDTNSLAVNMNKALTYAGTNELTQFMPVLESIARNQNLMIKDAEDKKKMNIMFDSSVKMFGNFKLLWEGKESDIKTVANQIKNSGNSPDVNLQMMDLALKNIGKSSEEVVFGKTVKVGKGTIDPVTGEVIGESKYGDFKLDKESNKYYADYNNDKKYNEGEGLTPETVSKVTGEQERQKERRESIALNRDKVSRVQATYQGNNPSLKGVTKAVLLKEDGLLYDTEGKKLDDQGAWMYQTSTSFATSLDKKSIEGRKDIVRLIQTSLRDLEYDERLTEDETAYSELQSILKYKGDDNDYYSVIGRYKALLGKNRTPTEDIVFRKMHGALKDSGIELDDEDFNDPGVQSFEQKKKEQNKIKVQNELLLKYGI